MNTAKLALGDACRLAWPCHPKPASGLASKSAQVEASPSLDLRVARPSRPHPTASDGLAVGPKGACCLALTAKPKRLELARLRPLRFTFPDRAGRADYRTEERLGILFGALPFPRSAAQPRAVEPAGKG